jgi:hypothetical protein
MCGFWCIVCVTKCIKSQVLEELAVKSLNCLQVEDICANSLFQ